MMKRENGRFPPLTPELVQAIAQRVYQLWLRDLQQAKERQRWLQHREYNQ